jgi:hypothetical protein
MRLPLWLTRYLCDRAMDVVVSRPPDFVVGDSDPVYLRRWYVTGWSRYDRTAPATSLGQALRRGLPNIYIHQFLASDDDRALHDHPWFNLSILLFGCYTEHTIAAGGVHRARRYGAGALKLRRPGAAHRIEIERMVLTLFITGPKVRDWGFHCPAGWRPWQEFTRTTAGSSKQGKGCA